MIDYFRQILVPSDLSPGADRALSRAWQIAAQHNAVLTALHVVEPVGGPGVPRAAWERLAKTPEVAEQALRHEAEAALRRQLGHNQTPRPSSVDILTRVGDPLPQILEEVRERSTDLVVLGAHGRHSMRDRLLGTMAESVVRCAACSVLVVRIKPAYRYKRVLVPVDFSDVSRKALMLARRLAPVAKLLVMHAYEYRSEDRLHADGTTNDQWRAIRQERELKLGQELRSFVGTAGLDSDAVTPVIRYGNPSITIVRATIDLAADLIAIGTSNIDGMGSLLLGSIARHTLREARCDVLAVHP